MAFRLTPEEYEEICELVRLSGMNRQDYIVSRLKNKEIVVKPSTRVYKALKDEMGNVYAQLLRIRQGGDLNPSLEKTIALLGTIFTEMKAADNGVDTLDEPKASIYSMSRQ